MKEKLAHHAQQLRDEVCPHLWWLNVMLTNYFQLLSVSRHSLMFVLEADTAVASSLRLCWSLYLMGGDT